MRLLRWSCLWSVLAIVPACSDTSDPVPTPTPSPDGSTSTPDSATPDSATPEPEAGADGEDAEPDPTCDDYAQLECTRNRDCFPVFLDWTYGSYDACLAQAKQTCSAWSALEGSSLTVARLAVCLRANIAAGCKAGGPFAECQALPGNLLEGSGCMLNDQCGTGYCRREGTNGCGECTDKLSEGAVCSSGSDCRTARCSSGRCAPILKEGEVCAVSADCLKNLVCHEGTCQVVTLAGEGQACGGATLCEPYMTCASGLCVKDVAVDIGQKCGKGDTGAFSFCRAGDCNAESVCVSRPAVGAACADGGSCAGGGVCYQGRCRALTSDVCDLPP
jgi:hypothetical protein